jgi:hypothetical protein
MRNFRAYLGKFSSALKPSSAGKPCPTLILNHRLDSAFLVYKFNFQIQIQAHLQNNNDPHALRLANPLLALRFAGS